MKKRIVCAAAAMLVTALWSLGMIDASAQYRETFMTPVLGAI